MFGKIYLTCFRPPGRSIGCQNPGPLGSAAACRASCTCAKASAWSASGLRSPSGHQHGLHLLLQFGCQVAARLYLRLTRVVRGQSPKEGSCAADGTRKPLSTESAISLALRIAGPCPLIGCPADTEGVLGAWSGSKPLRSSRKYSGAAISAAVCHSSGRPGECGDFY
jgi:hypothetical protein